MKWRPARGFYGQPLRTVFAQQRSSVTLVPQLAALLKPVANSPYPIGSIIKVNGFVRSVRKQKNVAFAVIGDGSTLDPLQVVLSPEQAEGLSTGAAVAISGEWRASPFRKQQTHELHAKGVEVLGDNDSESYPLQKKYHSPEFLRTIPHLRTRIPHNSLLLRLRSYCIANLTRFFADRAFIQTHPPIITSSDCEGAGQVFNVAASAPTVRNHGAENFAKPHPEPFFRSEKYLTVSSQLHLEALAQSVGRVWTLSPTFRAERSDTARHLSEFYMLEAELAFTDHLAQIMDLVEDMLKNLTTSMKDSGLGKELMASKLSNQSNQDHETDITAEELSCRWEGLIKDSWPRITYAEAVDRLETAATQGKITFEFAPSLAAGLQAEHERFLAQNIGRGSPVFVTDYPQAMKPFYMAPSELGSACNMSAPTVACFDLLVPDICEIAGGSMREHRLQPLRDAMLRQGLISVADSEHETAFSDSRTSTSCGKAGAGDLQWYLDLRRYGSVPHGGFGLGFDRLLGYLAGISNVREIATFPRWYSRCHC